MFLFRRATVWAGCAILALAYLAAEELAGAATGLTAAQRAPLRGGFAPAAGGHEDSTAPPWTLGSDRGNAAAYSSAAEPGWARYAKRIYRICRVTAYCDRGTTAAGVPSGLGQCAAPEDIPFGSIVYIPALDQRFVVTDRTHRRFRRSTVDLFIPSAARCRQFGRHYLECEILINPDPPAYGDVRVLGTGG